MVKRLDITPDISAALEAVARAERLYTPGFDSASIVELPRLALANAVLRAVRSREQLAKLPARAARPVAVVDVALVPKRRRA